MPPRFPQASANYTIEEGADFETLKFGVISAVQTAMRLNKVAQPEIDTFTQQALNTTDITQTVKVADRFVRFNKPEVEV